MQKKPKADDTRTECTTCKGPGDNENLVRWGNASVCVCLSLRGYYLCVCVCVPWRNHILLMIKVQSSLGSGCLCSAEWGGWRFLLHRRSILTCHIHLHSSLRHNEQQNFFYPWCQVSNKQNSSWHLAFYEKMNLKKLVIMGTLSGHCPVMKPSDFFFPIIQTSHWTQFPSWTLSCCSRVHIDL